jgi:hypothetical protein
LVTGQLAFHFHFLDPSDESPVDVIACEFRIGDRDGKVWATTSRFTSELFVAHMFDASLTRPIGLFRTAEAGADFREAFQSHAAISGMRFSSDDRFYRTLLVGERVVEVQFRYTTITFDMAIVQDPEHPYLLTALAIRVRSGSLMDTEFQDLGELGFFMSCTHPLRNNTAASEDGNRFWGDNPMPGPLVFSPLEGVADPNETVEVIAASAYQPMQWTRDEAQRRG